MFKSYTLVIMDQVLQEESLLALVSNLFISVATISRDEKYTPSISVNLYQITL